MWNSSAQTTRPMTQGPDKLPLLPAVGAGAGTTHADMTKDKDPRPLTNTRRDLFPNLKSTSRPTLSTGTIQMPSLTNQPLLRSRSYGNLGMPARPQGLDQPDVTAGELLPQP